MMTTKTKPSRLTRDAMYKHLRANNVSIAYDARVADVRAAYDEFIASQSSTPRDAHTIRNNVVGDFARKHNVSPKRIRAKLRSRNYNAPYTAEQIAVVFEYELKHGFNAK